MKSWIVAAIAAALLYAGPAGADEASHRAAALRFYEASRVENPAAMGKVLAGMIAALDPSLKANEDILANFARELVTSPAFRDAQVKIYMDLFTEDELDALAQIFTTRVYSKYRRLRMPMVRRSTAATIALLKSSLPELERRIRERAAGASGARGTN